MTHSTPDVLALLALGEEVDAADARHIPICGQCRTELAELQHVVTVGRSTTEQDVLVPPSPAVWDRISAEVQTSGSAAVRPRRTEHALRPDRARRRWTTVALAAALALVVGLGAGFGISRVLTPKAASAGPTTLNALPRWPGANGTASVETDAQGGRTLMVTVELPPTVSVDGRMEVWLSDSQALDMTAMGFMSGSTGRFPIPASIDLKTHPLVDVSLEPRNDPDPAHSDVSVVRGRLTI
jgi:anti-sigma-K factor RskA